MYDCIATIIAIIILLWYLKPSLLFNVDNDNHNQSPKTYSIADVEINIFGLAIILIAIFTYYFYIMYQQKY